MKKLQKLLLSCVLAAVFALAFSLSACAQQLTGLAITCAELTPEDGLTLEVGEVRTLGIEFYPEGNTLAKEIVWTAVANPKGCVTVDDSGNVTAVKPGAAVVTAKVTTKFGPVFASCEVTVTGDGEQPGDAFGFSQSPSAAAVTVLNRLVPSGQSNATALTEQYFAGWTAAQIDAWNDGESEITSDYELVLAAFRAQKGPHEGAIIVKTATTGYWSYDEDDPDSGVPYLILYVAIDKDGKFLGMDVEDMGKEDFYSEDNFSGLNVEVIGKTFVGKTMDDLYDYIDVLADGSFFTVIPEKVNSFADATIRPSYTSYAFIQAMLLATEVFVSTR